MRNLKKALALVMVFALVLGTVASAATFSDIKPDFSYSEEVNLLADLGVLAGFPDGTYQPEATITRVQAAAVIFRILTGRQSAAMYDGATKFYDVPATYWGTGYINYCADIGAIGGYPDGSFKPDQAITVAEYESMLVRALGLAEGKTLSFPNGYLALADANLINEDVASVAANAAANRGLVSKLTYNTIMNATYQTLATRDDPSPKIIEKIFKIVPYDGIVTGTQFEGTPTNEANKFRFTDTLVTGSKTGVYTFAKVTPDMIGTSVKMYLKTTAANDTSVYAVVTSSDNKIVEVSMANIGTDTTGDFYKVSGTKYYMAFPAGFAASYSASYGLNVLQKVTLVSNDGDDTDAEYATVKAYTYTEYQQTSGNKIYTKDVIVDTKSASGTVYDVAFDSTIVAGNKVLVYQNAAKNVAEIIKCDVTEATLDGITGSGNGLKYTFSGSTKNTLNGSTAAQKLGNSENLGKIGKFIVAPFFNIVVETSAGVPATNNYYYLKALAVGTGFDAGKTLVKVVNTKGETVEMKVKSAATLDGAGDMSVYATATGALAADKVYSLVVNSSNEITAIKTIDYTDAANIIQKVPGVDYSAVGAFNVPADAYNTSSKVLEITSGVGTVATFKVDSDSVSFVKVGTDIYVYQGTFPATIAGTMEMTYADVKTDAFATIKAATFTSTRKPTASTSVYGMLVSDGETASGSEGKAYANFKIAMNGEVKLYSTTEVAYTDTAALLQYTDANSIAKGAIVEFSMTDDGKIVLDSGKHALAKVNAINVGSGVSYNTSNSANLGYVADFSGNLLAITGIDLSTTTATGIVVYNVADDVKVYEVKASDIGAATVSARAAVQVIKNVATVNRTKVAFVYDTTGSDTSKYKITEIYVIKA